MTYQRDVALMVKNMSENEAKKTLATIYSKFDKINNYDYTKENFLDDFNRIYSEQIVGNLIFGDSSSEKNE